MTIDFLALFISSGKKNYLVVHPSPPSDPPPAPSTVACRILSLMRADSIRSRTRESGTDAVKSQSSHNQSRPDGQKDGKIKTAVASSSMKAVWSWQAMKILGVSW